MRGDNPIKEMILCLGLNDKSPFYQVNAWMTGWTRVKFSGGGGVFNPLVQWSTLLEKCMPKWGWGVGFRL